MLISLRCELHAPLPQVQDEFQRISLSNGQVILGDDPSAPSRLRVPAGDMAMSRALGDLDAHQYGMSSEPEFPGEYCLQEPMRRISRQHLSAAMNKLPCFFVSV
eukprot:g31337.t1